MPETALLVLRELFHMLREWAVVLQTPAGQKALDAWVTMVQEDRAAFLAWLRTVTVTVQQQLDALLEEPPR